MPKSLDDMRELPIKFEIPIEQTKEFWERLEDGEIYTSKCSECGEVMFPPQVYCRNCLSTDIEWIELDGEATIKAFSHVVVRPMTFSDEEPYTVAVAEFKEHEGVRAFAWVEGFKRDEIDVGLDVQMVVESREEGPPTYKFVPVED